MCYVLKEHGTAILEKREGKFSTIAVITKSLEMNPTQNRLTLVKTDIQKRKKYLKNENTNC